MSENQIDESRFMIRDEDLMRLVISPLLRIHMNSVQHRVKRIFPIIYRDMERFLNTPYEQLVEMEKSIPIRIIRTRPTLAEEIVEEGLKHVSNTLDFLRNNQQKIHIASIPVQGISILENHAAFIIVTVPVPRGPSRSAIYDVFSSKCIMLFHPVSLYVSESYLGSAIVSGIAECMRYTFKWFYPFFFKNAMWIISEGARLLETREIWPNKEEARHMIDDLKRRGVLLVLESFLYDKILITEHLSKTLLEKSIIESIPPIR